MSTATQAAKRNEAIYYNALVAAQKAADEHVDTHFHPGFVSVVLESGRTSFARWARENGGFRSRYNRAGLAKFVPLRTQSVPHQLAYAHAFAATLNSEGIKASVDYMTD